MSNRTNAYTEVWTILNSLEKTEFNISLMEQIDKELMEIKGAEAIVIGNIVLGMQKSYMFRKLKVDTAKKVAEKGYKAIMKNKAVYIVSVHNKLLTFITRFISLSHSRKSAMKINKGDAE